MLRLIIFIATLFITSFIQGQKRKSIELDFLVRYDKHADFTTRFFDRTYTNKTKLWGLSHGSTLNFLQPLNSRLKIKIGFGYYKLVVDKIRQTTRLNIIAPARTIDYNHPTGIQPLFASSYYHYNCVLITGGLSYESTKDKLWNLNIGGDINYLYSFSQLYNIDYDDSKYRTKNGRTLGYGVTAFVGIIRRFNNDTYYINPRLIIPVLQNLHGDQVFGEDQKVRMNKWFNGGGISFTVGKYL